MVTTMSTVSRTLTTVRLTALAAMLVVSPPSGWAAGKGPDAGGYTATDQVVYSFVDIAGTGGASVLAGVDDETALLTLGFPFNFYGEVYAAVCVSSNGAVYFLNEPALCASLNDFVHLDLTGTRLPFDLPGLFPLWSDLTFQAPGAGSVLYQTMGAVGSRRFVLQWNNAYPQGSQNPGTFQVVLSEGTNGILFQYRTANLGQGNPASQGAQATIGIRNAGGLDNGQQLQWSFDAPVLGDSSALSFSRAVAAPVITARAKPSRLWPPNNRPVAVTVSGTVTLGGAAVGISSAAYSVIDEYGQTQPSGAVTVAPDGSYSVTLTLTDSRRGNDRNGRTYTIVITVVDTAGNTATGSAVVLVPHDQGRDDDRDEDRDKDRDEDRDKDRDRDRERDRDRDSDNNDRDRG